MHQSLWSWEETGLVPWRLSALAMLNKQLVIKQCVTLTKFIYMLYNLKKKWTYKRVNDDKLSLDLQMLSDDWWWIGSFRSSNRCQGARWNATRHLGHWPSPSYQWIQLLPTNITHSPTGDDEGSRSEGRFIGFYTTLGWEKWGRFPLPSSQTITDEQFV